MRFLDFYWRRLIRIGDGSTRVWEIPWLPCTSNGYLTTMMSPKLNDVTVSSLMDENRKVWDGEVIDDICNEGCDPDP